MGQMAANHCTMRVVSTSAIHTSLRNRIRVCLYCKGDGRPGNTSTRPTLKAQRRELATQGRVLLRPNPSNSMFCRPDAELPSRCGRRSLLLSAPQVLRDLLGYVALIQGQESHKCVVHVCHQRPHLLIIYCYGKYLFEYVSCRKSNLLMEVIMFTPVPGD